MKSEFVFFCGGAGYVRTYKDNFVEDKSVPGKVFHLLTLDLKRRNDVSLASKQCFHLPAEPFSPPRFISTEPGVFFLFVAEDNKSAFDLL